MKVQTYSLAFYVRLWCAAMLLALAMSAAGINIAAADEHEQPGHDEDGDVAPAPPSIGADVPLTYFGPAPAEVQKELIGPHKLLKAGKVDLDAGTVEMPLYRGRMVSGEDVWYVVFDTDDKHQADALGLNHSAKLTFTDIGRAVRRARLDIVDDAPMLTFYSGTVDFTHDHKVVPGDAPNYFPPKEYHPGSVGDEDYSPLVKIQNVGDSIYNAPIVAFDVEGSDLDRFCDGNPDYDIVHDKVVSICPREGSVVIKLTPGFSFARPVLYASTDANNMLPAALEHATYAPGMRDIATGGDDSLFSAVERIFLFVNGPTGLLNPQRQGLNSALSDGRPPLNVLGGIPTIATDYSPLWDLNPGVWTQEAIEGGFRSRMTEEFAILGMVDRGWITGLDGGEYGSIGMVVNCPIVFRFL